MNYKSKTTGNRLEFWKEKLVVRIKSETAKSSSSELTWLAAHLKEYLERWLSFAQAPEVGISQSLKNNVFYVLLAASDLLEERVHLLDHQGAFLRPYWCDFYSAIKSIQENPDSLYVPIIAANFYKFLRKVREEY